MTDTEAAMPKLRKADMERLRRLLSRWDADEKRAQSLYGPPIPRSMRATQQQDACALAAVLSYAARCAPMKTDEPK